jgi:RimJ/RimL family protein N-acetyltransferase
VNKISYFLRPVNSDDAQDIYNLRTNEGRGRFLNPIDMESHVKWLEAREKIRNDYYFAIENSSGEVHGYVGLYNMKVRSAEWGRWIMRSNSPAVFISYHLILKFAFNLELEFVYCNTHQQNGNALRIHDKLPYSLRERVENKSYVRHTLEKRDWDKFEKSLVRYSRMKLA